MKKIMLCIALVCTLAACPPGPNPIGDITIDCLGSNRSAIDAILTEFKPIITRGEKVNWSNVYQRAKQAGKDIGGCFIAELTQFYLGGGFRVQDDAWDAHNALTEFRESEFKGVNVEFSTVCKRVDNSETPCKL